MTKNLSQPVAKAWLSCAGYVMNQTMLMEKKTVYRCMLLVTTLHVGTTMTVPVNTRISARLNTPDVSTLIH